jgi:uncharacterized protein YjbI with pentapeptide repeats
MDNKKLGNKIAKMRKEGNMSQAQLAEILFVSPQAVGKWERGESLPDFITLNRLTEIFAVDLNYFAENSKIEDSVQSQKVVIGTVDQTTGNFLEDAKFSITDQKQLLTDFSGNTLAETDFSGVNAPKRKFLGSELRGSDFSMADFTASIFKGSNIRDANFDSANLTDCIFSASNMTNANFNKTVLIRTEFYASELNNARFSGIKLTGVKFTASDIRKTIFENCEFNGVSFKSCDMKGISFDGQVFVDVKFDNADLANSSFRGVILRNVSFRPTFALTNRYYKNIKTIDFDGASMDKLTYAALKGVGVSLENIVLL